MAPGHLAELDVPTLWSANEAAAEQASLAVYVARIDCDPPRILYASERAGTIVGRPQPELIGQLP